VKTTVCKSCIYCILLTGPGREVFVCANKYDRPGRLTLTNPAASCGNHKKPRLPNRPTVTQPTDSNIRFIPLTRGKVTIVDAEDYGWLMQYKWYANKKAGGFYAARIHKRKMLLMHRLITNAPKGLVVDHIDANPLNNRRSNLRLVTVAQNQYNRRPLKRSSKYKGVSWNTQTAKWSARIEKDGRSMHLGLFKAESDAAKTYDKKAKQLFGEFAFLNFPKKR